MWKLQNFAYYGQHVDESGKILILHQSIEENFKDFTKNIIYSVKYIFMNNYLSIFSSFKWSFDIIVNYEIYEYILFEFNP